MTGPEATEDSDGTTFDVAFGQTTGRSVGLVLAESLNEALYKLLERRMVASSAPGLLEDRGPLATFSSRIDASHAFGLISDRERRDLNLIRRIRNDFAHVSMTTLPMSFDTEAVRNRCIELTELPGDYVAVVRARRLLSSYDPTSARDRFIGACLFLWLVLSVRRVSTAQLDPASPITHDEVSKGLERIDLVGDA
jgi:hypothetical protein